MSYNYDFGSADAAKIVNAVYGKGGGGGGNRGGGGGGIVAIALGVCFGLILFAVIG